MNKSTSILTRRASEALKENGTIPNSKSAARKLRKKYKNLPWNERDKFKKALKAVDNFGEQSK